jgi:THAP domain
MFLFGFSVMGGVKCCVCGNTQLQKSVSFHVFPKDSRLVIVIVFESNLIDVKVTFYLMAAIISSFLCRIFAWLSFCGLKEIKPTWRICSAHFEPHMFTNSYNRTLTWKAIPTLLGPLLGTGIYREALYDANRSINDFNQLR